MTQQTVRDLSYEANYGQGPLEKLEIGCGRHLWGLDRAELHFLDHGARLVVAHDRKIIWDERVQITEAVVVRRHGQSYTLTLAIATQMPGAGGLHVAKFKFEGRQENFCVWKYLVFERLCLPENVVRFVDERPFQDLEALASRELHAAAQKSREEATKRVRATFVKSLAGKRANWFTAVRPLDVLRPLDAATRVVPGNDSREPRSQQGETAKLRHQFARAVAPFRTIKYQKVGKDRLGAPVLEDYEGLTTLEPLWDSFKRAYRRAVKAEAAKKNAWQAKEK